MSALIGSEIVNELGSDRNGDMHADSCPAEAGSAEAASGPLGIVLKVQAVLLGTAFVIAFMLGALAPSKGQMSAAMALPEWNDQVQPWSMEVARFADRLVSELGLEQQVALEFSPWILEAASRQSLAPELLAGLVLTESSFRKNVTSPAGAVGPAQVRPKFWSKFCGTSNLRDPAENIYCGAQILAYYIDRCGAEVCALGAYNTGPYSKQAKARERYVSKVAQNRAALERSGIDNISL